MRSNEKEISRGWVLAIAETNGLSRAAELLEKAFGLTREVARCGA
jgi:hypothetical protein